MTPPPPPAFPGSGITTVYQTLGYQSVAFDFRNCSGATPSVAGYCASTLCPAHIISVSNAAAALCALYCGSVCPQPAVPNATSVAVWNPGVPLNGLLPSNFSYTLSASCTTADTACPSFVLGAGACGGRGTCVGGTCACDAAPPGAGWQWAGVGCEVNMTLITLPAAQKSVTLLIDGSAGDGSVWRYFLITPAAGSNAPTQVSLSIGSGDPLLFLQPPGPSPDGTGSLPGELSASAASMSAKDVPNAGSWGADVDSWYNCLETAANVSSDVYGAVRSVGSSPLWAAVYDPQGSATYNLTASAIACPLNCSGVGACSANGSCACQPGWIGNACESPLFDLGSGGGVLTAELLPGSWLYVLVTFPDSSGGGGSAWSVSGPSGTPRVDVTLQHSGASPVLLLRAGEPPSLTSGYDLPNGISSQYDPSKSVAALAAAALISAPSYSLTGLVSSPGAQVYVGLFNYACQAGREHSGRASNVTLTLSISGGASDATTVSPMFLAVILGIVLSMFLCLILSLCRRYGMRFMMRRRNEMMWPNGLPPGTMIGPDGNLVRIPLPPPRGLSPAVIASFTPFDFAPGTPAAADAEAEMCSVCLCDYEVGDSLRQLPDCKHCFHMACIDPWLAAHQTCPLCRESLAAYEGPNGLPAQPPPAPRRTPAGARDDAERPPPPPSEGVELVELTSLHPPERHEQLLRPSSAGAPALAPQEMV